MELTNLPLEELKKYGIINNTNNFNSKLSGADIEAFKNGSILHLEDEKHRLSFTLKDKNTQLEANVYFKDIINHKELSTAELLQLSIDKTNHYKVMADYGTITKIESGYHGNNKENEMTTFVELENEKGKSRFYGNDLHEKMKDFQVGDKVQIENIGISKASINTETEIGIKEFTKYDNVFKVSDFEENKKSFKSKLFEYDPISKNVQSIDTTKLEIHSINGIKLTKKQNEMLKKGQEVKLDEELTVQASPKANNNVNLKATARMLVIGSIAIDGGMSYLLVKGVIKLSKMAIAKQNQIEHTKFQAEFEKSERVKEAIADHLKYSEPVAKKTAQEPSFNKEDIITINENKHFELQNNSVKNTDYLERSVDDKILINEKIEGFLLDKGEANYQQDKNNGMSFYLTIMSKDDLEPKTIWGVDLKDKSKDISVFENISITNVGKTDVTIKVPLQDQNGNTISLEEKIVKRNTFEVKENKELVISHKEAQALKSNTELLNKMKGFLQTKSSAYPENKDIISSINIIDKFTSAKPLTKKEGTKNLNVVDHDTFEDAKRNKEIEKTAEIDDTKKSKTRTR